MKFSKDYVLFCHITTQIPGEKYGNLLSEKGGRGFPHLVFMDDEGSVLAEHKGDRTAEGFSKTGQKAKDYLALKAKAAKGDKIARIDFVIAQLVVGKLRSDEAAKQMAGLGKPTPAQQAKFDAELVNASVLETVKGIESDELSKAAGKKFYGLFCAGKPGPTSEEAIQPYYILMLNAAEEAKDPKTFEAALGKLKEKFGNLPQAKAFFTKNEKRLEDLKSGNEKK